MTNIHWSSRLPPRPHGYPRLPSSSPRSNIKTFEIGARCHLNICTNEQSRDNNYCDPTQWTPLLATYSPQWLSRPRNPHTVQAQPERPGHVNLERYYPSPLDSTTHIYKVVADLPDWLDHGPNVKEAVVQTAVCIRVLEILGSHLDHAAISSPYNADPVLCYCWASCRRPQWLDGVRTDHDGNNSARSGHTIRNYYATQVQSLLRRVLCAVAAICSVKCRVHGLQQGSISCTMDHVVFLHQSTAHGLRSRPCTATCPRPASLLVYDITSSNMFTHRITIVHYPTQTPLTSCSPSSASLCLSTFKIQVYILLPAALR